MSKWYYSHEVMCHWCGVLFNSKKGRLQARFCCPAHKQAHYRAYKSYVTAKSAGRAEPRGRRVTRKKQRKSSCP